MKIDIISFSTIGGELAKSIIKSLSINDNKIQAYIASRHADKTDLTPFSSVYQITEELFHNTDVLIFIGACGIAVRSIAPQIKSKLTDPAVLVCDEMGRHVISLLSGHAGGANVMAEEIATYLGATPVITTASDTHAALLNTPLVKNLVLGIGCRKGVSAETIERASTIILWDVKIPLLRVSEIASIDLKREEKGLHGFARAHKLPLHFYSSKELADVAGEFSASERVLEITGVDNVCERAATLCGQKGKLILKKTSKDGVTVAVFEKDE